MMASMKFIAPEAAETVMGSPVAVADVAETIEAVATLEVTMVDIEAAAVVVPEVEEPLAVVDQRNRKRCHHLKYGSLNYHLFALLRYGSQLDLT